ncbi:MAG: DUF5805 domain-containing protein [archaeon]
MTDEESTSRTAVKTYVPAYQKDAWESHAEALEMSQSEFVRTMVQTGRRHYNGDSTRPVASNESNESPAGTSQTAMTQEIRSVLATRGSLTWEELIAVVTEDVEDRLEESLDELQEANAVKYSGREGGYTLVES